MTIGFWDGKNFAIDSRSTYSADRTQPLKKCTYISNSKVCMLEKPFKYSADGKEYLIKAIFRSGKVSFSSRLTASISAFCDNGRTLNEYLDLVNDFMVVKPVHGDFQLALVGVCVEDETPAAFKLAHNYSVTRMKRGSYIGSRHELLFVTPAEHTAAEYVAVNCILVPEYCGGYFIDSYDPVTGEIKQLVRSEMEVEGYLNFLKNRYNEELEKALGMHYNAQGDGNENSDTTSES